MTIDLQSAIVYDIEVFPNLFCITMETLFGDAISTWEISEFRDDRPQLRQWMNYLQQKQLPMLGFNSVNYDYPIMHHIFMNPGANYLEIYAKNQAMFASQDRGFSHMIWDRDRFAPQIDLFRINHFDNVAKTTSLKALQINMRSPTVMDSPVDFGQPVTREQIDRDVIPYNKHDVKETKRFAHHCMKAIEFRRGLIDKFGLEVMNYNDGKIGAKTLEQRLGEDVCYQRVPITDKAGNEILDYRGNPRTKKVPRQTPRYKLPLNEIIFPYIQFNNPEFQRVLEYMKAQTLTPDDLEDPEATVKTKGVFSNLIANVGGIDFHFGTGGIHGSVVAQRIIATEEWLIRDIDVGGFYPDVAIKNRLAPEHLGSAFIGEYAKIPIERALHAKGTYENASLKLAGNVPWGQSNSRYSIFFDPKYAMTIPINGQLMLCMLAEWLITVPTFQIIQVNTDGITYRIHRDYEPQAAAICRQWEAFTLLTLEDTNYQRMWIRDVNNYIAQDMKGKLKQKGAYWHPTPGEGYAASISEASPPAWHKDLGNVVAVRAAVAAMVRGIDPAAYIRAHSDPFDFMCRVRATGGAKLLLGGQPVQNTTRYYVAIDGAPLVKIGLPPPGMQIGQWKRAPRITKAEYDRVMIETNGEWDPRVCTKAKTTYQITETGIEAGWKVAECNDARSFRFENVNYDWYIAEARKLII